MEHAVVLGLGNTIRRDESVGMRAVERLRRRMGERNAGEPCDTVELVEGGVSAFDALSGRGGGRLFVVDAAEGGGEPGTVYRARGGDVAGLDLRMSLHDAGLAEALVELELAGDTWREVVVFGVEPADTGWGEELSPEVERALDTVIAEVEAEIGASRGAPLLTGGARYDTHRA